MNKNRHSFTALALVALSMTLGSSVNAQTSPAPASASGTNWYTPIGGRYVGIDISSARYSGGCGLGGLSCEDSSDAYSVYAGGMWNRNFGLEIGATDFGSVDRAGGTAKAYGFSLKAVGVAPLTESLAAFAKVIARYPNITVVSDEIYEHIIFDGKHESIAQFPEIYEQVVTVNGVSKAYAMTGYRIGYIGAPLWIAKACDKMQGQFTSAASSIAQQATIAALATPQKDLDAMRDLFKGRRDMVVELFSRIEGFKTNVPGGAFYLFPEVSALFGHSFNGHHVNDANDLCMYFLNECHVAMVPGEAFGAPEYIRLSYATSDDNLKEAARRVRVGVEKLLHHGS